MPTNPHLIGAEADSPLPAILQSLEQLEVTMQVSLVASQMMTICLRQMAASLRDTCVKLALAREALGQAEEHLNMM